MKFYSKMCQIIILLAVSSVLFTTGCSQDKEPVAEKKAVVEKKEMVVSVASDATWPPMEMVNEKKELVGFNIDFMKAVAKEAGFKVIIKNTAWDGIFAGVEAGKYDAIISSVTITEKRKKSMDFSAPYVNAGQVLVVSTASTAKTIADMKGKKLGAQIGTTGAIEIKKVEGVTLKSYDEIGLTFEDMAAGRIDGAVCDTPIAANYALQKDAYKGKFKIAGVPFTEESYGIVVKKGNADLLKIINKGIKAVQAKGIDKELEKKWLQ